MNYDFDTIIDRRDTESYKWNVRDDELPMWVADMDFKAAPEIIEAIENRVSHGVFGYNTIPKYWKLSYINWWEKQHNYLMDGSGLLFCKGVVPLISSIVRNIVKPGENVLIQTPVYNMFFDSILNNRANVIENPLIYNSKTKEYTIDFIDLEEKLSNPKTKLMILCNPHNPIGKIWTKDELLKIGKLAFDNDVIVISDEIHCDITRPGMKYIPFASVADICAQNSITCIAPTKTFNIAGLQTAAAYIPNEEIRNKIKTGLKIDELAEPNSFAITATVAAYEKGEQWLEELREYLFTNREEFTNIVENAFDKKLFVPADATYLLWMDVSDFTNDAMELATFIRKETGLYITAGNAYGECGRTFLRINVACSRSVCIDGANRLIKGISKYRDL